MESISIPYDESKHPARLLDEAFETVAVIFVPSSMYKPNARVFGDLKTQKSIRPIAQTLQLVAHLVYHPEFCRPPSQDEEAGGTPTEALNPQWYYLPEGGDTHRAKTRQFIEAVYAPDMTTVIGWRWFIFGSDPQFDLGAGVSNILLMNGIEHQKGVNQTRRGPPKKAQRWEGFKRLLSRSDWAYGVCDTYLNRQQMLRHKEDIHSKQCHLWSEDNPANPYRIFTIDRAVKIRGGNVSQSNILAYVTVDAESTKRYRFPCPEHVWEIDSEYFNPGVLDRMEFPTEQKRTVESPLRDICLFQGSDGGEYRDQILDIMEATHGFAREDFSFNRQSDFAILEQVASKIQNRELARLSLESEKQAWLRTFKLGLMEDFRKFWCLESHISVNIKHMMRWEESCRLAAEEEKRDFTLTTPHQPVDTALSPFANLMVRRLVQYEKLLKTSTVHRELLITIVATRDAYRRSFDLHTNPLLAGAGSSSKSYILNCVDKLSIPGTVQTVTHITAKADAIDDNQNDIITLFHEFPQSLMGFDQQQTATGDPMFKERLTSNKFKTKLFCVDEETGKRSNRIAESECIGVMGGCTNDPPGKIPEALRSRFLMIMCPQIVRDGHEVIDQFGSKSFRSMNKKKADMIHEHHSEQYMICLIHKLIWTKVLTDVNLSIAHTIFRSVLGLLDKEGIRTKDPRHYTRLENTARTLTIMHAIEIVINTPGGALFNKPFEIRDLFALEEYLFCTEEIAYFTISLLQDMYINPAEREVALTLTDAIVHYPPPDGDESGCAFKYDEDGEIDRNYVVLKGDHSWNIANKLSRSMRKNKSSPENIQAILADLSTRTILAPDAGGRRLPIYEFDRTKKMGCVATAWLDRVLDPSFAHLMQKAIRGTFHKYSRKRTILLGETHLSEDMPHIWRTIDVVPNTEHALIVHNTGYQTDFEQNCLFGFSPDQSQSQSTDGSSDTSLFFPSYRVDADLESIEFLQHLDSIGKDDGVSQDALPAYCDEALPFKFPAVARHIYPQHFIVQYQDILAAQKLAAHDYSRIRHRNDGSSRLLLPPSHRRRLNTSASDGKDPHIGSSVDQGSLGTDPLAAIMNA